MVHCSMDRWDTALSVRSGTSAKLRCLGPGYTDIAWMQNAIGDYTVVNPYLLAEINQR